jgi:hypothetical protein
MARAGRVGKRVGEGEGLGLEGREKEGRVKGGKSKGWRG